jgi:hypothetical protein
VRASWRAHTLPMTDEWVVTVADDVYELEERRLPRWRRARNWAVSLAAGSITPYADSGPPDGGVLAPPVRTFVVRDRRTGAVVGEVREPWDEERDLAVVLADDLAALTPAGFAERWLGGADVTEAAGEP